MGFKYYPASLFPKTEVLLAAKTFALNFGFEKANMLVFLLFPMKLPFEFITRVFLTGAIILAFIALKRS